METTELKYKTGTIVHINHCSSRVPPSTIGKLGIIVHVDEYYNPDDYYDWPYQIHIPSLPKEDSDPNDAWWFGECEISKATREEALLFKLSN